MVIETDAGLTGCGEFCPCGENDMEAHSHGVEAAARLLAPALIGEDPRHVGRIEQIMDHTIRGYGYAKAPIDMACWDIAGQAAGMPIADLMGGGSRTPKPIAASVGAKTVEATREVMDRYRARGYVAHSVKIGGDVDRDLCDRHGIVLIFDEVVTGFRFAYGGAQQACGVTPDLCTLGKVVGGGFPLAAVAGRRDIMAHFDAGAVGQDRWLMMLGTLSGNPVAAAAGLKTMEILRRPGSYDRLGELGARLMAMFAFHLDEHGIAHRIVGHPALFDIVFIDRDVRDYRDVFAADADRSARFNAVLRRHGVFKSPGKVYPCLALTDDDLALTDRAIAAAAAAITEN